jgi:hypothetical protein
MNETIHPNSAPDATWLAPDDQIREHAASMLEDSTTVTAAADGLLNDAVQGAHNTIDRLAGYATPAVEQLGESALAAGEAVHAKADQLRETRDELVESARTSVRRNPLVAVVAALMLGFAVARITR